MDLTGNWTHFRFLAVRCGSDRTACWFWYICCCISCFFLLSFSIRIISISDHHCWLYSTCLCVLCCSHSCNGGCCHDTWSCYSFLFCGQLSYCCLLDLQNVKLLQYWRQPRQSITIGKTCREQNWLKPVYNTPFIKQEHCCWYVPGLDPESAEDEPLLESLLRMPLWFRWRCFRCRLWCRLCLQRSSPPLHRCFFLCFFSPTVRPLSPVAEASRRFSFSLLLFFRRFLSRSLVLPLLRSLNWNTMTTKWKSSNWNFHSLNQ